MKTMIKTFGIFSVLALFSLAACKKTPTNNPKPVTKTGIESLTIPDDFNFTTTTQITLTIHDQQLGAKYDIYSLKSETPEEIIYSANDTVVVMDDLNQKLASGLVTTNGFTTKISVPAYHKYLYLVRSKDGHFSRVNLQISGNRMDYTFQNTQTKSSKIRQGVEQSLASSDVLYSVSGNSTDLNSIDLGTGTVTKVGTLPYKSIANAVDKADNWVYVANKKSPFQLGYYDLSNGTFNIVGNMASSFPRMDYNPADGLLYISNHAKLYTIDPSNAQYLQTFSIHGLANDGWGDLAFADDGTLYILSKSGVYKGVFAGNTINATLISDNSLPLPLTSMAVGTNGKLYMSRSNSGGKLIEFDPNTAAWNYVTISKSIPINDLGILRYGSTLGPDTDGDGVLDSQDDYPNDPERAFNNYFPGDGLWATLAFEDLWPSKGDYDFNDLVVGYNFNQVTNANNEVVDVKAKFNARHNGAGLHNGFAFQIPTDQTNIASVTTNYQTLGNIAINGNGTESGQNLANIVVFEDTQYALGKEIEMTVHFGVPQDAASLGTPPYNPYLIKDGDVNVEVHLPWMAPTALADQALFGTADDSSVPASGRYYKSANNLPWAINIVYQFKWMKEKQDITSGYLHFGEWAESDGTQYADWYKDLPGYRDNSFLDADE
jgi:LruC domain-containing protein